MSKSKYKFIIRNKMLKLYEIEDDFRASFLLKVDWLLENAVFPTDRSYAENLLDLWNVYMPGYRFDKILLDYFDEYFIVLRFVHNCEIFKFNSTKKMQETLIKNYLKYRISQGNTNRMVLIQECFDFLKDYYDRTKLYNYIDKIFEYYFPNQEIDTQSSLFLKRFQDNSNQAYTYILERIQDIGEQRNQELNARNNLLDSLEVIDKDEEKIYTLINILLIRIAMSKEEDKFSEILKRTWNDTFENIEYSDKIYSFIEKYEKPYMNATCFGIKDIKDEKVIKQLYKDAIILSTALQAIEEGERFGLKEIVEYWKNDGRHFWGGCYFHDAFDRMKTGFHSDIILNHKNEIHAFYNALKEKIKFADFQIVNDENLSIEKRNSSSELDHAVLNEKDRYIEELHERISDLEEKIEIQEKEVLSEFISLLDSRKYDYVLGQLYRTAYSYEFPKMEEIQRILKNLFEIMNINGIDIYGEIGDNVSMEEIKKGKYRLDKNFKEMAKIKYPGYRIDNSVILHPFVEEE